MCHKLLLGKSYINTQAPCPSQVPHTESHLKTLAPYSPCLKNTEDYRKWQAGLWSFFTTRGCGHSLLLRIHFTVFYFRLSHGLVRHISQVPITMTGVTPSLPCFNRTVMSRAAMDLTWSLQKHLWRMWIYASKQAGKNTGDMLSSSLQTRNRNSSPRTYSSTAFVHV